MRLAKLFDKNGAGMSDIDALQALTSQKMTQEGIRRLLVISGVRRELPEGRAEAIRAAVPVTGWL